MQVEINAMELNKLGLLSLYHLINISLVGDGFIKLSIILMDLLRTTKLASLPNVTLDKKE